MVRVLRERREMRMPKLLLIAGAVGVANLAAIILLVRGSRADGGSQQVEAFIWPGKGAAASASSSLAAAILASNLLVQTSPALAEESLAELLLKRDEGIARLDKELQRPQISVKELLKLEEEELKTARLAEKEKLASAEREEKEAVQLINEKERAEKASIEKAERDAKDLAKQQLKTREGNIKKEQNEAVEMAKQEERAEKQEAIEKKRAAVKAAAGKAELIIAAEDDAEAAIERAGSKLEERLFAVQKRSEDAIAEAYQKYEADRTLAMERAELLGKVAVERAETARSEAARRAELAEKNVVEEEESFERKVLETVEKIEEEELAEENQLLLKLQDLASTVGSVLIPVVVPGLVLFVYAVIASTFAPPPDKCLGGESEKVREKMGRGSRSQTRVAALDPWDEPPQSPPARAKKRSVSAAGGAATAAVLLAGWQVVSTSATGFAAFPQLHAFGQRKVLKAHGGTTSHQKSFGHGNNVPDQPFWTPTNIAVGTIVATLSCVVSTRRMSRCQQF